MQCSISFPAHKCPLDIHHQKDSMSIWCWQKDHKVTMTDLRVLMCQKTAKCLFNILTTYKAVNSAEKKEDYSNSLHSINKNLC